MSKIGFVGMGNMAKALASGFIKSGAVDGMDVYAYAPTQDKLMKNADEIGFLPMTSVTAVVQNSDIIIIACKPYQIDKVLDETRDILKGKAIVSIASGWFYQTFADKVRDVRIQCVMPNTPAMVGEGVFLFEEAGSLAPLELAEVMNMFSTIGLVVSMPTRHMSIASAISGCGPAFMDVIMEAYGDAAVKYGLSRETAYKLIAKTMVGSAKLQLETGKHPGLLKDEVCSPAGTTIRGIASLEKNGMRNACIECIDAIMNFKTTK
ncbi:MAG: pyrroline-5-carboxylate reductase [Lachnospiraceae bacterium]|nr:pyrroline-5-carboxylate reductase [Lachnospiraceae bacterium]